MCDFCTNGHETRVQHVHDNQATVKAPSHGRKRKPTFSRVPYPPKIEEDSNVFFHGEPGRSVRCSARFRAVQCLADHTNPLSRARHKHQQIRIVLCQQLRLRLTIRFWLPMVTFRPRKQSRSLSSQQTLWLPDN